MLADQHPPVCIRGVDAGALRHRRGRHPRRGDDRGGSGLAGGSDRGSSALPALHRGRGLRLCIAGHRCRGCRGGEIVLLGTCARDCWRAV